MLEHLFALIRFYLHQELVDDYRRVLLLAQFTQRRLQGRSKIGL